MAEAEATVAMAEATEASDPVARLRQAIAERGIVRTDPTSRELLRLDGGGVYRWQFYMRGPLLSAEAMRAIGEDFWARNAAGYAEAPFQVAAIETAGVPVLTGILMAAERYGITPNAFTIRKEPKSYGLRNRLEGQPNDLPVVLVDDLASPQHNAFWGAVHALREARLRLWRAAYVVVFKMANVTAPVKLRTTIGEVELQSLYTLDDFGLQ